MTKKQWNEWFVGWLEKQQGNIELISLMAIKDAKQMRTKLASQAYKELQNMDVK